MSNQTRLFVLVFLAFLPTVGLYWYANGSLRGADRANQEAELLSHATRVGLTYERILDHSEMLLGALSEMNELRSPRRPDCNAALSSVMGHLTRYTAMQLIEVDGFVSCGSLAIEDALFVGDRYYHQAALANRQFTVGNFVVGRLTGKPIVGLAHPVDSPDRSSASGVLAAYLDLDELGNAAYDLGVPQTATFTGFEREGTVMVRVPSGSSDAGWDTVGASVPESFPTPTGEFGGAYLASGTDLDGVERIFAVEPLRAGGTRAYGHVLIGVDAGAILERTDLVAIRQLQILALAGMFLIVLAWIFGHYTLLKDEPAAAA